MAPRHHAFKARRMVKLNYNRLIIYVLMSCQNYLRIARIICTQETGQDWGMVFKTDIVLHIFLFQSLSRLICRDEIAMAGALFFHSPERCQVTQCVEYSYMVIHFVTKFPGPTPSIWNLVRLFPFNIWILVLITLVAIILFFQGSYIFYKKIGQEKKLISEEIVLFPFRSQSFCYVFFFFSLFLVLWGIFLSRKTS